MKFILVAIIATVAAQEEEKEMKELFQSDVCSTDGSDRLGKCGKSLCCGDAKEEAETASSSTLK